MSKLSLIFANTRNDLKAGDGRLAVLTQAALIFFLLTLTLVSASIQQYLSTNLSQMLGSDMVIESHTPLSVDAEKALTNLAPRQTTTELVNITLAHKDKWERVQLKLVDDAYPLQGSLTISDSFGGTERPIQQGPQEGSIWLGTRLAVKLGIKVGETLTLGETQLRLTALLSHEPDRIMEGHSVALRAMVHRNSLPADGLQTSNIRFRYLLEADRGQLDTIEKWAKEAVPGAAIIKKYGGQHPLAGFWRRTENFLGLASVILFFMGAVAMDMTNRRWLSTMRYRLAIYSSFGTPLRTGITLTAVQWGLGFVLATVLGGLFALLANDAIISELQSYFPGLEGGLHAVSAAKTIGLVFCLLLALQVPALLQLRRASVATLIRETAEDRQVWHRLFWGLLAVSLLAGAYSDNLLLTGLTLGAIAGALLVMIIISWLVLRIGDWWGNRKAGLLPFAFFIMRRRIFAKSAQILGLGLCGLLLLFTLMLMRDLGGMMEGYFRTQDGNLLVTEAQGDQVEALEAWAAETGSTVRQMHSFVSAQLIAINDLSLDDYSQKPSDTMATVKSPIRLSWSDQIPANNRLVDGNWWEPGTENWQQISTEPEVMTDLGLSFGDTLTYQIGNKTYKFTLVASHAFRSGGSSITFWFQVPTAARARIDAPTRYMGSMELPETAWSELATIWQAYPTLTLMPLKEMTERFDRMLGIFTKVTSGYAAMVLLLALFVVSASVSGFRADDQKKNGLLMSMGLREKDCLRLNLYDWSVTALIAATGAIIGTWLAGWMIYETQFGLTYNPDILWVAGTIAIMVATVCLIGYLACRQSLKVSVRDMLTA